MINLIIKCRPNDFKYQYGIILNYGSNNQTAVILTEKGEVKSFHKGNIITLKIDEQINIFNKYFAEYMKIPQHLIENNTENKI